MFLCFEKFCHFISCHCVYLFVVKMRSLWHAIVMVLMLLQLSSIALHSSCKDNFYCLFISCLCISVVITESVSLQKVHNYKESSLVFVKMLLLSNVVDSPVSCSLNVNRG